MLVNRQAQVDEDSDVNRMKFTFGKEDLREVSKWQLRKPSLIAVSFFIGLSAVRKSCQRWALRLRRMRTNNFPRLFRGLVRPTVSKRLISGICSSQPTCQVASYTSLAKLRERKTFSAWRSDSKKGLWANENWQARVLAVSAAEHARKFQTYLILCASTATGLCKNIRS